MQHEWGEGERVEVIGGKAKREEDCYEDKCVRGWIILEWILDRWDVVMWSGLVRLKIGTGGELL
jgi:hypothetical protein